MSKKLDKILFADANASVTLEGGIVFFRVKGVTVYQIEGKTLAGNIGAEFRRLKKRIRKAVKK